MKTGVIGLGAMGANMARNLHRAGLLVGVWNRSTRKADAFANETGIKAYPDCASLARASDLLLTCVSRDADLREVVAAASPGLHAGALVVDCSTVRAETAQRIATQLAQDEIDFLDAPVSGGKEGAIAGTLSIMVGGDSEVLNRARPALEAIGQRIVHLGPVGAGQRCKAVNQIMAAGINAAVTEALAFAQAADLPEAALVEVISAGAAGNWFLQHRGLSMLQGHFEPGFKLELHHKDLEIAQAMAKSMDVALPLTQMMLEDYDQLMQAGYGSEDISALFRLKRRT